jgi:glutamine amidotransferase
VIALVDYGAGNLTSVKKALTAIGADFAVPETPTALAPVQGIIVPGVGHFSATGALDAGWTSAIRAAVGRQVPLLGICVGMQWLFEGSEEAPGVAGLGVLPGVVRRLRGDVTHGLKVPHVGWNALALRGPSRLLKGIPEGAYVYFTHSYAAHVTPDCVGATSHGETFAAVVERGLVFGVQFHPEKSSDAGLRILRNFVATVGAAC